MRCDPVNHAYDDPHLRIAAWEAQVDVSALRAEWQRLYRAVPSRYLSRDLLLQGIAFRLQEQALGGLRPSAKRKLAAWSERAAAQSATPPLRLKPGTVLVRAWHGATYTVRVTEDGFDYQGQPYASLSTIAQTITGAHWSGPRFFGLRKRSKAQTTEVQDVA